MVARVKKPVARKFSVRYLVMAVLGVIVGIALLVGIFAWKTYSHVLVHNVGPAATPGAPVPTPDPLAAFNILIMGYGGGTHAGGKLTDTIMVAHIAPHDEKITLISIPRDLWVSFPVEGDQESSWKVNAAYQIGASDKNYPHKLPQYSDESGGGALAEYAITKVTGQPIQHFVAVSFAGFTKAIDVLGGVDVKVERTFDDFFYPIDGQEENTCGKSPEEIVQIQATVSAGLVEQQFACRYEHLHFDAGAVHMDGTTALKYVRSRHSTQDGGDFNRAARQRQLILAVKQKLITFQSIPKLVPFVASLTNDMQTDIDLNTIQDWLGKRDEYSQYAIETIALTDQNMLIDGKSSSGQFILNPRAGEGNWDDIHQWINDQLSGKVATPSASPTIKFAPGSEK